MIARKEMNQPSVHSLLKKYGIRPRRRLGQHFLAAMPTTEKIAVAFDVRPDDVVLEIGSGFGIMTAILSRKCKHVFAVERDSRLIEIAQKEFGLLKNVTWIESDILGLDLQTVAGAGLRVIGNLPYNISSPVIFWMIENRAKISSAVVMLQREVAQRITAPPDCKDYGVLSVLLRAFANCKKLFDISAASFIPPPEVVSSVIKIDFDQNAIASIDWPRLKTVVKAAFGRRRKTLRNALIGVLAPAKEVDSLLDAAGIDGRRRPETLLVGEFVAMSKVARKTS